MATVGTAALRYEPVADWATAPSPMGEVVGVATDSNDDVYLLQRGDPPVLVLDADGNFLRGWGSGRFVRPHGLWVAADDSVYVVDDLGHSVRQFTGEGTELREIGPRGVPSATGATSFDHREIRHAAEPYHLPTNLAVGLQGRIYVTDGYGNARVHAFSSEGELLMSWGEPGSAPGCFCVPHGIGVDREGLLYVADRENSRIQVFGPDGTHRDTWTDVVRPCEIYVDSHDLVYVAELGARAGLFPWMTPDPAALGGRISIWDRDGRLRCRWGNRDDPRDPEALYAPHDIWVDSRGDIYVAQVNRSALPAAGQDPTQFVSPLKYIRRSNGD